MTSKIITAFLLLIAVANSQVLLVTTNNYNDPLLTPLYAQQGAIRLTAYITDGAEPLDVGAGFLGAKLSVIDQHGYTQQVVSAITTNVPGQLRWQFASPPVGTGELRAIAYFVAQDEPEARLVFLRPLVVTSVPPAGVTVNVTNEFGNVSVTNIVSITNTTGDIVIQPIVGAVTVTNLFDLGGVTISNSMGDVNVTNVFGDVTFAYTNVVNLDVTNTIDVDVGVTNYNTIAVSNTVVVGSVSITNILGDNYVSNYVDSQVNIIGLTVDVSNVSIDLTQLTAVGQPSGAVARADGAGGVSIDTNFTAKFAAFWGTNFLGYAGNLVIGEGLVGSITNDDLKIELAGMNFPGAPGVTLTNVVYYHSLGTKTAQWYQVAAGVTQIFVHANSGGASGAGTAGAVGRVTIPVEPFEWLSLYIAEAGFTQTNSTGAPEFTDQAWPGGGRGASRVINQKMHASAGYTAIFRGVADTNTYTNLLLVLAGAAGVGNSAGDRSGGNGGGVIGENGSGLGTGYTYGRGATETNHGASYFSNFIGLAITGSMPARLRGGDAQIATNYIGPAAGGSPGWYSGSSSVGYAAGHGSLSASAGSGNSWFNEAAGVRGEIASGKGVNGPPWTEDYYYRTAGVKWGKPGQPGGMWIAEIVEVP